MKNLLSLVFVLIAVSGCYSSHERLPSDCLDGCAVINERCDSLVDSGSWNLDECVESCYSTSSRTVLYVECATCIASEAQCRPEYIREFCWAECGL